MFAILNYALNSNMAGGYKEYGMEIELGEARRTAPPAGTEPAAARPARHHHRRHTTNCNGTVCWLDGLQDHLGRQCSAGGTGCRLAAGGANLWLHDANPGDWREVQLSKSNAPA